MAPSAFDNKHLSYLSASVFSLKLPYIASKQSPTMINKYPKRQCNHIQIFADTLDVNKACLPSNLVL